MEHLNVERFVDESIELYPLAFELKIAATQNPEELAVHAIVHDEENAEHIVSIMRTIADEIERQALDKPNECAN